MKFIWKIIGLFFLLLIVIGVLSFPVQKTDNPEKIVTIEEDPQEVSIKTKTKTALHYSYFADIKMFEKFYNGVKQEALNEKIIGGILPHHLIVGEEFAKYFEALKNQNPEVIVVVGPNHYNKGSKDILTTPHSYKTPYGELEVDTSIIEKLTKYPLIGIDKYPFDNEHSISSEVAFIKKTFPQTKIVPLILKSYTKEEDAEYLGQLLSKILPQNSLVLASVDFSHYQPEVVADFHDKTSFSTIQNFDFESIYELEIDSPASIYTLLTYLKQKSAQKIVYSVSTNSASYTNQPEIEITTSHFFLAFTEGDVRPQVGISVLHFGDAIFDRYIKNIIEKESKDVILEKLAGEENRFFRGNHFNMLNFEGVITDSVNHKEKIVTFNHSKIGLDILRDAKFNVVSLANNHSLDYYQEGLDDTKELLKNKDIDYVSHDNPCVSKKVHYNSIAFCGFNEIDNSLDLESAKKSIKMAKKENDKILVSIHWGWENVKIVNDKQKEIARSLIDEGADIIIGHHPHVIHDLEIYKNAPIIYSLGNFIFDQFEKPNSEGLGVGVFFENNKMTLYFYPIRNVKGKLELLAYEERKEFYKKYLSGFEAFVIEEGVIEISF